MSDRWIKLLSAGPVHPGRGAPSRIELRVIPQWLKGDQVATGTLTRREAIQLIEQLALALRVTEP